MQSKPHHSDAMKKFIFYADEIFVYLITILAVIFSDALSSLLSGKSNLNSFKSITHTMSWTKVILGAFIAIIINGGINEIYKYEDNKPKPPLRKRLYTIILQGIAWKSLLNLTGIQ